MMTRRDNISKRDHTSPELPRLNKDIQKRICEHKRQKWIDFVENMDHKTDITKVWRTIKGIAAEQDARQRTNLVLTVQAASRQAQHFKARQTLFFKRNPIGNEGDQWRLHRDGYPAISEEDKPIHASEV